MSSRTVPRFVLTALLGAALTAPAAAQEGGFQVPLNAEPVVPIPALPTAPMPREKASIEIKVSFDVFTDFGVETKWTFGFARPVAIAPMPHESGDAVRSIQTYCWQTLRDEVYGLVRMNPPVPPMVPPQDEAFVIGAGGLQRVMPMPEPPQFLVPSTPVPTGSFVIGFGAYPAQVKQTQTGCFMVGACGSAQALPGFVPHKDGVPAAGRTEPARSGFVMVGAPDLVCPPCPLPIATNPLNGTWYRDMGVALIAVTFAGDEMTVRMTQREGDATFVVALTAHCTVTKDGLVYGAITSADVDLKDGKSDAAKGMELAELSLSLQELADMPFSFRAKATTAGLMVSHLKVPVEGGGGKRDVMIFGGLYKHAKDGKVPELKPVAASSVKGRCCPAPAVFEAPVIGPPLVIERIGVDFNAPVMGQPLPPGATFVVPAPVPASGPIPPSARPVSCAPQADAMKQMAADVFIQMAQGREPIATVPLPPGIPHTARPISCAEPASAMKQMAKDAFFQMVGPNYHGGMTLPPARYLEHYPQYFAPDPAFPLPRELSCQEAADKLRANGGCDRCNHTATQVTVAPLASAAHKPGVVGTWVRETGAKRCVVKIAAGHFTATVTEAHEVEGKTVTAHMTLTVDYYLMRDGVTAVGLVTSVDANYEGDLSADETEGMSQWIGELRRALEDKPLALTIRLYGDALVIGNVRMQTVGGLLEGEPAAYLGGRYRSTGDKPLPALKAVKAREPKALPVCVPPSPYAGNPLPGVYGYPAMPGSGFCPPACPPAMPVPLGLPYPVPGPGPTGDLLPPQHLGRPVALPPIPTVEALVPAPTVRVIEATVPESLPSMSVPTPPVLTMPQPVPPGKVSAKTSKKQKYSSDPNVRMQQLLDESEDLRRIKSEWHRFWFNDQPRHLTPERIHGGIY